MPSIITTVPDADFSGMGLGIADTPFSTKPWAGYVFGSLLVGGTDYASTNDFCGAQGDLTQLGAPVVSDFAHALGSSNYYTTPFNVADHMATGSGTIVVIGSAPSGVNQAFVDGKLSSAAGIDLVFNSPSSFIVVCRNGAAASDASRNINPLPQGTPTMFAGVVTPTTLAAYARSAAATTAPAGTTFGSGDFSGVTTPYRIGAALNGTYPGGGALTLVLFFQSALTTAQLDVLYSEAAAWLNEHAYGL